MPMLQQNQKLCSQMHKLMLCTTFAFVITAQKQTAVTNDNNF